jgi:hypothetical protein
MIRPLQTPSHVPAGAILIWEHGVSCIHQDGSGMKEKKSEPIDIHNVRLMCDLLYLRMEKEIARLKKIARKHQGAEKKFVIDLIHQLEQEEGDYRRTRSSSTI